MLLDPFEVIVSAVGVTMFGLFSLKAGVLDHTGFVSATLTGCVVLIFGGLNWFAVLVSFLVFASLFTRYKYSRKKEMGAAEEKGGARSWRNVVANGSLASLSALGYGITSSTAFSALFLGAIGTASADTLATEIGLLSPGEPRLITNLEKRVNKGVSGGVSPLGELASLLGALLVGAVAWVLNVGSLSMTKTFTIVLISGFLGSSLDSILGATIQSLYKCTVCEKMAEKRVHCGKPACLIRGKEWIDNSTVNFISTLFGALIALVLSFINVF